MKAEYTKLTFEDYKSLSIRTLPILSDEYFEYEFVEPHIGRILDNMALDRVHCAMGVVSETLELRDADSRSNVGEELADKVWYLSGLLYINNNYMVNNNFQFTFDEPQEEIFEWSDIRRKMDVFDNIIIDSAKKELAYRAENKITDVIIINYLRIINSYASNFRIDMEEALAKNINKLYVRFPDKFNIEDAIFRKIEEEKKVL